MQNNMRSTVNFVDESFVSTLVHELYNRRYLIYYSFRNIIILLSFIVYLINIISNLNYGVKAKNVTKKL